MPLSATIDDLDSLSTITGGRRLLRAAAVMFAASVSVGAARGAVIVPISQARGVAVSVLGDQRLLVAPDFGPFDATVSITDPRIANPPLTLEASQHSRISESVIAANGASRTIGPAGGNQFSVSSTCAVTFSPSEPASFTLVGQFQLINNNVFPTYSASIRDASNVELWRVGDNNTTVVSGVLLPGTYTVRGGASNATNTQIRAIDIEYAWCFAIPSPSSAATLTSGLLLVRRARHEPRRGHR